MDKLHQAQVKAYQEAAAQSVKKWAVSFPLQPMEEGDSKTVFVNRCIASITNASGANTMPNWKFENAKATALNEIRKHANAMFEKYHPAEDNVPDKVKVNEKSPAAAVAAVEGGTGTADEAEDESEGGAETEDGEMTGDDDNVSDQEQTTTGNGRYVHPNRNKKNKVAGVKKTMPLRKGTRAKTGFRNNKGGRGAGRGGRGRGNRVQK
jgi:hypothetical protein